jgi:transcription elongation factor Elf1
MDGRLGMLFACPRCGQVLDGVLDFRDTVALIVTCVPCQTRFDVLVDGTVKPLNRELPAFRATIRRR